MGVMFFMLANAAVVPVEGVDYTVIPNANLAKITKNKSGKVNVKEFFSFTCIHCKDVELFLLELIFSFPFVLFLLSTNNRYKTA